VHGIQPTNPQVCESLGYSTCNSGFSVSNQGCCPFVSGVCCANNQTCCPSNTKCTVIDEYTASCAYDPLLLLPTFNSAPVCKSGPPDWWFSKQAQRAGSGADGYGVVLVFGDSISIGYTPFLQAALPNATVIHSPWDTIDGGSEEIATQLLCFDIFTRTANGTLIDADVIVFNSGIHNLYFSGETFGQSGTYGDYVWQFPILARRMMQFAQSTMSQILWLTTTPVPYSLVDNLNVTLLNTMALDIISANNIPTVDLYQVVTDQCGSVLFWNCPISLNRPGSVNVHYSPEGYQLFAEQYIGPAVSKLLAGGL